ncbi:MAG: hypothetical protein RI994_2438 [Pseudomonadota bacterium]
MRLELKRYFDHGMPCEGEVKIVQLLSACGPDCERHTQVVASFAGPHFKGGWIETGVKLLGNLAHGFCKTVHPCAHDFDWKVTRVFYQRLSLSVGGNGGL